jgi:uncharacterized protein (TIGR01777 family)
MPTILITGGTGMIGRSISAMLTGKGYDVIILSRKETSSSQPAISPAVARSTQEESAAAGQLLIAHWDPARQLIAAEAIGQADYIIHLAGAGVADKRWSAKRKKEIVESRTEGSALLVRALQEIPNNVKAVVSISAVGWYGPDPSVPNPHPFVETDPADKDFLGETCRLWEAGIAPVTALAKRLVIFRTGIVLSREGGALAEFKKPVKLGVAAILGSGRQVVSWVHINDLCRLFIAAIEEKEWQGIYNAVSPAPVSNRELTLKLAARLKGRFYVSVYVPTFLLKIIVGEMSVEVLKSATVSAEKIRRAGFQFGYPSIDSALDDLLVK